MRHGWVPALLILLLAGPVSADLDPAVVLARGINMDHVFEPYRDPTPWTADEQHEVEGHLKESEFALVAKLGFTHVRLNLGRAFLQDFAPPCALREDGFTLLDRAVEFAGRHRLGLILDLHQIPVPPLDTDRVQRQAVGDLWAAIAKRYRGKSQPILFELLNEPRVESATAWRDIVSELVGRIRAVDPERWVVVTGGKWGGPEDLMDVGTLTLPRIVYTFHCYDPFVFTHQGADWTGDEIMKNIRGIRYPIDPAQMRAERAKAVASGGSTWPFDDAPSAKDRAALAAKLQPIVDWGKRAGVPLYCGEFGVHIPYAPPADRAKWIADMVSILTDAHAGWAMWAYHAGFDLVDPQGRPIPALVAALGLKPS